MPSVEPNSFFKKKRPWSKYKDLILDYYLQPYLAKVARLRRPIAVIDCCAGPGKFESGEDGSPLIIAKRLNEANERGANVFGCFIEANEELFSRLKRNLANCPIPCECLHGVFQTHVNRLLSIAKTHTVFLYVDPLRAGQLLFDDLRAVYEQLHAGQSIEVLLNFMSPGFYRQISAIASRDADPQASASNTAKCDSIAGGNYWRDILDDNSLTFRMAIELLAEEYAKRLQQWFSWSLAFPIRETIKGHPKYHLVFGSRHMDAVELMNLAMVKARRELVGAECIQGMLFPNQPADEVYDPQQAEQAILDAAALHGRCSWKELRVYATMAEPSRFKSSEFDKAIKSAISKQKLESTWAGRRVEEQADVWPADNQQSRK